MTLKRVRRAHEHDGEEETIFDYFSLTSDRMMLGPEVEREAAAAFAQYDAQPVLTYLANEIVKVGPAEQKGIPYSTIAAIDPAPGGPLVDRDGKALPPLADDEIALTSWAAEDQQAKVGDRVRVTYFEPETTHGNEREASAEFRVAAIIPLTEPSRGYTRRDPAIYNERPTPANDPELTPAVKGITDQASIDDWEAPFPFEIGRIRDQDDTYWDHHRTTPKAYVSLSAGQRLWGSRFGEVTSIRIPATPERSIERVETAFLEQLRQDAAPLGLAFQPLRQQGLAAAAGTTPFDVLFLLLSMFIIAAALMLIWLLFRLGIEQRAAEIGTLLALGWTRPKTARLLLAEACLVAAVGAAVGVLAGVGYAWLMLAGLRTWWIGAISSPFLTLYVTPRSLAIGFFAGLIVSAATIWLSLRALRKVPVRQLMAGDASLGRGLPGEDYQKRAWRTFLAPVLLLLAIGLGVLATQLGGEAQAGAFLGCGAALLAVLLMQWARWFRRTGRSQASHFRGSALAGLAVRNAGRNVGRSITTIALMATASFLIVAVSSFRQSPSDEGVGGFNLLAESSQPIIADLNSPAVRTDLLAADAEKLANTTVLSLRVQPGDDASCRNLYQPTQPRVLGVPPAMVAWFDQPGVTRFGWSASAAKSPEERANPWRLLLPKTLPDEPVPVVLDKNTAMYSLKLYRGVGEEFTFTYDDGTRVRFRVAGLLSNSVLQGSLLVGEENFERLFPTTSGYGFFLIRTPPASEAEVANLLEDKLGDEGFDTTDSRARLADLLAVQNTYISTFQSLGAIGLLLGTFGLAAVQLRSVFERRKELALLRAAGFRRWRLGEMVLLENLLLLIGGLATGAIAALAAVLPHMITSGAQVPLADLAAMLGVVLVVGVLTGLVAVRATLRAPLVAALRGE
ncbi:MAG: ABC transporter permease [Pirellulaceae bacterium]